MSLLRKKRTTFRPSLSSAGLEDRVVLSVTSPGAIVTVGSGANGAMVLQSGRFQRDLTPHPPRAPAPFRTAVVTGNGTLSVAQIRAAFSKQLRSATSELGTEVRAATRQLFANGATPTAQDLANFNSQVSGAIDALALRLSAQASLLPNSTQLVSNLENNLLGSSARSLDSKLTSTALSTRFNSSVNQLVRAFNTEVNTAMARSSSTLNQFFNTTSLNKLSVNSSGQRIPLEQFMGNQVINGFANTLGNLANSFPTVATSVLNPDGTTTTPSQTALAQFQTMSSNALSTAAFQLGSALSLFPGSQNAISLIQPAIFGSTTANGVNTSLVSALNNVQFGSPDFNTGVSTAFNTAFTNTSSTLANFFGLNPALTNNTFADHNFSIPFLGSLGSSTFNSGFNNGFATGTNTGFVGFGTAPTTFNTNFGTGFDNFVATENQNIALSQ